MLAELPREPANLLALVYQLALCEVASRQTLWNPVLNVIAKQIVAGYKSLYDDFRSEHNKTMVRRWFQTQIIPA